MSPCPADDQLRLLLDEQLPPDVAAPLVSHTDGCSACQQRLERLLADSLAASLPQRLRTVVEAGGAPPPAPTVRNSPGSKPAEDFLERLKSRPAPALPGGTSLPGYEVLEELGRGGMAVVYRARQVSLNRSVALKMVLTGARASLEELARFRREAEAVASLQHPNIVAVYEVGELDGLPFFAMELVEGGSLDRHLAGRPQPARQAAELVRTLALAVQYAHAKGIVHRDLKPANVLLAVGQAFQPDAAGGPVRLESLTYVPKITDFGLAKRLGSPERSAGQLTQTFALLGTPSYMAPEQAEGQARAVGPPVDVYALGALLYELLTGRPPFRGDSPLETLRQVRSDDPVAPTRLAPQVPRDLETICLKCLHKEPARRYPTADALAEDLRRFLANETILARPAGLGERGVKWAKRRPTAAALVLVSGLAVLLLAAGLFWHLNRIRGERDYAERNFRRARQAVDEMLTEVAQEHLAAEPRMEEKRRVLLEKALTFYQEFLAEKRADPAIRKETALASRRVGDILRLLGRYDQALAAYLQAIDLLGPLAAEFPGEPGYGRALGTCHSFRGEVLRQTGRPEQAADAYRQALRLQDALVARFPDEPDCRMERARTHYNLGILAKDTNHLGDAETSLGRAITDLEDLAAGHRDVPRYRQHLARAYLNLGPVLRRTDRPGPARDRYRRAISLLKGLAQKDPDNPDYRHELGVTRNNLGNLLAQTDPDRAQAEHTAAVRLFAQLAGAFPQVPVYRQELANSYNSLGSVLAFQPLLPLPACAAGLAGCAGSMPPAAPFLAAAALMAGTARKLPQAQNAYERAEGVLARLVKENPKVPQYRGDLGMTHGNLGWLLTQRQKWAQARAHLQQAITLLRQALKPGPPNPAYQQALRNQYQTLAAAALHLGDHAAAAAAAAALPEVFGDRGLDYYYAACFLARCVPLVSEPALKQGYTAKAVKLLRAAAARGVPKGQRLPDIEEAKIKPLGPQAVAALDALNAR
jgi:tetratricopeptide (TPR) repeat protein/tRNA A-37 threonylcarbamoyl transferase component Bud32